MKLVVVGGNSRGIGKTSVVAGLIRALPHYRWTAIKLTPHGHGACTGEDAQHNGTAELPSTIDEETDRSGRTDTSRFLVAGARRALWVRVRPGMLETALRALERALAGEQHVILESNSILRYWQPDVYLTVLDPAVKDFKNSAQEFLPRADACLVLEPGLPEAAWEGISLDLVRSKPLFCLGRECRVTREIVGFVESRLATAKAVSVIL